MKKSIIALAAVSAIATSAFAQDNVSVYGVMDMGYAHSSADRTDGVNTKNGIGSLWSPSRIGFKGTEGLNSDLSVGFTLEYGLSTNTNAGIDTAREQSLGLTSKTFGTVKAGYMETLGKTEVTKYDAMEATAFSTLTSLKGTTINNGSRAGNTIAYVSPSMGGLVLGATYSTDITTANTAYGNGTKQERVYGVMADYTSGPLSVGYVYQEVNDSGRTAGLDSKEHMVGAKFDVTKDVAVLGTYQTDRNTTKTTDKSIWTVGAQVALAPNVKVEGAYGRMNDKTAANADADAWGVQANYSLSKRTSLYGGYTRVNNDNGGTAVALGTTNGVTPLGTNGLTSSGFGAGLKHSF